MRKILAVICTLFTLYAFKETFVIFTSKDAEIATQRPILIVIALSITIPLMVLSLWLWKPKNKQSEES